MFSKLLLKVSLATSEALLYPSSKDLQAEFHKSFIWLYPIASERKIVRLAVLLVSSSRVGFVREFALRVLVLNFI